MEKKRNNATTTGIPDNAVTVMEDGGWAVLWSNTEKSFYFASPDCPSSVLRLSRDELLTLVQEHEKPSSAGENTDAIVPVAEECMISISPRDKRQFKRFTRRCEAEFSCRTVSKRGIASDFSINGLFIRTGNPFPPDEVIDIIIHLPDNSVSLLQGKVKRALKNPLGNLGGTMAKAYKNGMGLVITQRDANYLNFIRSLIK